MRFVRASRERARKAHFKHETANPDCRLSKATPESEENESGAEEASSAAHDAKGPWHEGWQRLGRDVCNERYEAKGIGCAANRCRPRDLGDVETQQIVELQHSPLCRPEYDARNEGVMSAVWIFDATRATLWDYGKYAEGFVFCEDSFRSIYPTDIACVALFHCQDGTLYRTACDSPLRVELDGETKYVRLLQRSGLPTRRLDTFFADGWPLREWEGMPTPGYEPRVLQHSVRVLSEEGRQEVTELHIAFAMRVPKETCTVIHAPPGAGKTTNIVKMIKAWNEESRRRFKVLVLTFNTATQLTMESRLLSAGIDPSVANAMTLDKLCKDASGSRGVSVMNDTDLCSEFWPGRNMLHHTQPGKGLHELISFRLKHPHAATPRICTRHSKAVLGKSDWNASLESHPVADVVRNLSTFASWRYVCDRDQLLRKYFEEVRSYDALIVDEMQDLTSAQEMRLLHQFPKAIVLVGDPMQAINDFKAENNFCSLCNFPKERMPLLPRELEWYGSWRLDALTARFIEEKFGRPLHSYRSIVESSTVLWSKMVYQKNTLVLCRSNQSVYEMAQAHSACGMKVVNGKKLASELRWKSNSRTDDTPCGKWASSLRRSGRLETVCRFLDQNSIEISKLANLAAASTVHQAKGFEYDHVAVHQDLLDPQGAEETCVSYVAFTRHKKSLTILTEHG